MVFDNTSKCPRVWANVMECCKPLKINTQAYDLL